MKKVLKKFSLFEWGMILSVILFTLYFFITDSSNSLFYLIVDSVAAISGIFCVVLCAKGKKSQYIWGVINVIGYVIISFINKYYGEVMLNALYYLPSQFIGYRLWKKNSKSDDAVIGKKLYFKQCLILLILIGGAIFIYKWLLDLLGGFKTLFDSSSTVISVVANLLMMLRYREQWLLWIIIDIITVIMWLMVGDFIMVTMWSVYLINAFYGYYNWTNILKE